MAICPITGDFACVLQTDPWGDSGGSEAVGVGDGFYVNDPGLFIVPGREYQENTALVGRAGRLKQSNANQVPDLSFETNASYVGAINRFLGAFFGLDATSSIDEGTVPVGTLHTLTVDDKLAASDGLTVVTRYNSFIDEIDWGMVDSFEMSWSNGERALLSFTLMGRKWDNASTTNTGTELDLVTVKAPVELEDDAVVVRLADRSTSVALVGADEIPVSELTISFARNFATDVSSVSAPYRIKPVPGSGGFSGQISFTLPDWADQIFRNHHDVGDLIMMDVIWTGGLLPSPAATETFKWTANIPQGQVLEYDHATGDRVGEEIGIEITLPLDDTFGMTDDRLPHFLIAGDDTGAYI